MLYTVVARYSAKYNNEPISLRAGDVADLAPDVAAFIERDAPGVIMPFVELVIEPFEPAEPKPAEPLNIEIPERAQEEIEDRQQKRGKNRRAGGAK